MPTPLGFQLAPLQGEHLYSLLSRYHLTLGPGTASSILSAAFGPDRGKLNILSPCWIRHLASTALVPWADPDEIISRLTPFPFFSRFLSPKLHKRVYRSLLDGYQTPIGSDYLPRLVQVRPPSMIQFCPNCVADDLLVSNFASWKIVHQLPGVLVCPDHCDRLRQSQSRMDRPEELASPPENLSDQATVAQSVPDQFALSIARNAAWLLRNPGPPFSARSLNAVVRDLLLDAGWIERSGKIRNDIQQELERATGDLRDPQLRALVGLTGEHGSRQVWLFNTWSDRVQIEVHPTRYLLLLAVLETEAAELVDRVNRARSSDAGSPTLRRLRIERGRKRELANLPGAVKPGVLREARARFLSICGVHPGASRTELRRVDAPLYDLLLRCDHDWLESKLPPDLRKLPGRMRYHSDLLDGSVCWQILAAARRLRERDGRPVRITRNSLAREAGVHIRFITTSNSTPWAIARAQELVDDEDSFKKRLLEWAAGDLRREGLPVSWRGLADRARVPYPPKDEDVVRYRYLVDALDQ